MGFADDIRNTEAIRVADIIGAVEDTPQIAKVGASSSRQDRTQDLWDSADTKVFDFRQSVTLRSLMLDQLAKGVKVPKKPALNRVVFKRTSSHSNRINAPNSVSALVQPLVART